MFAALSKERPDGLYVPGGPLIANNRKRIVDFAAKSRLPSMYTIREAVDAGGLMYYGVDPADSYRRVAYYVDRILKGTKPADLPVEQPTKFELVINLKTAKQIGLTIPPECTGRTESFDQGVSGRGDLDFDLRFCIGENCMKKTSSVRFPHRRTDNRKSKIQNRKWAGIVAIVVALAVFGASAGATASQSLPHRCPGFKHCFRYGGPL